MGRKVAIIGTGQTEHRSARKDKNIPELIREAVTRALENAELTMKQIDAIVIGNMEHFEGIHLSDLWALEGAGGYMKPTMKVATGGTTGTTVASAGYYHVASGLFDVVMAIGWEKQSEGETTTGIVTAFDPIYERPALAGAVGGMAVIASAYMAKYGITEEQAAKAAVKARKNAMKNPYAHLRLDLTVQDVLNSPMLAYPLKMLDMCPTSDGACAVIYASEQKVKKLSPNPAWVKAVTCCHNNTFLGDITFDPSTLTAAAQAAYKIAGITDPAREIDVAEIYEPCSFAELQWTEMVGFCEPGGGGQLIDSGKTEIDGELPINPSGGVMSTNPIGATGLIRTAEAAMQVRGQAGEHQVPKKVNTALVTGFGGSFWSDVLILGK